MSEKKLSKDAQIRLLTTQLAICEENKLEINHSYSRLKEIQDTLKKSLPRLFHERPGIFPDQLPDETLGDGINALKIQLAISDSTNFELKNQIRSLEALLQKALDGKDQLITRREYLTPPGYTEISSAISFHERNNKHQQECPIGIYNCHCLVPR